MSTCMSTRRHWIAWRSDRGLPKVTRCLAHSTDMSSERCMRPSAWGARSRRSWIVSQRWPRRKPLPISPSTFESGTKTLSKCTTYCAEREPSQVRMPLSSMFRPGAPFSTMNMVMPPRWRFSASVTAWTWMMSELMALEIHILVPLISQPPLVLLARVCIMPPGSDPALGSVWAKQADFSPAITGLSRRSICSPLAS